MRWRGSPQYGEGTLLRFPQFLLFLVGMPVKTRPPVLHTQPLLTWGLAAVIALISLMVWFSPTGELLADWLVFQPDASGLTWWAGLLGHIAVHGDVVHLLGNLYFLILFGRHIECCFGRRRLLGLFLLSGVLGGLLHGWVTGYALVGASGAVFGVLVFYVCQYPKARVIWLPLGWVGRVALLYWARGWVKRGYPVSIYLLIYGLFQLLLLYEQLAFDGRVSALAHLGGGLMGALIWLAWRYDWLP